MTLGEGSPVKVGKPGVCFDISSSCLEGTQPLVGIVYEQPLDEIPHFLHIISHILVSNSLPVDKLRQSGGGSRRAHLGEVGRHAVLDLADVLEHGNAVFIIERRISSNHLIYQYPQCPPGDHMHEILGSSCQSRHPAAHVAI